MRYHAYKKGFVKNDKTEREVNYMYLDPGFGGMLLQVIVVIAAMGGAILFSLRKKFRNLFFRNKDGSDTAGTSFKSTAAPSGEDDVIDALDEDKQ